MLAFFDRLEAMLIKVFLLLAALAILCQLALNRPGLARFFILLLRLEGSAYTGG